MSTKTKTKTTHTGCPIAIFDSGIGYQILSRHSDRISDIGYRISESDIIRQMIKKPLDGNAKLKQKAVKYLISDSDIR